MKEQIKKILSSEFEIDLFESAIHNLNDKKNKLRYNNFAYSIRELSRHFLHRLAPDENVKKCNWFTVQTENEKPTRTQRIKYAIQGGINDETLNELGLDSEELNDEIKSIKKTIDSLSKYTHINPESFDLKDDEITEKSEKVLSEFRTFAERIESYRDDLRHFLDGKIEEQMIDGVISNFYGNVDMLAPHHSLDYSEISEYHIIEINQNSIIVEVLGDIHFTLEYGSRKERREGDGLDLHESFPFQTKIFYEISSDFPSSKYEIEEFDVDTQEWYGDVTDEKINRMIDEEIDKK
ncbi:hypothetical protein V2550_04720 [Tenacibaculum maritimum]|uniref:pPIWI-associating nuclease domain-containing protein n=1 Tax=Tenacibaculum maritimum TaxID=107401 RepID=UPI0010A4B4DB|nr:hypothetical protein B9C57_03250 [Tenacibaculum maritimum]